MTRRIAYLGPSGTYSQQAAERLAPNGAAFVSCDSFEAVVAAAEKSRAVTGILPLENSTEGTVHDTLDLLTTATLFIQAELLIPIHHTLLAADDSMAAIREIWAHPQALGQCRHWLPEHAPHAAQHAVSSSGEAARLAAQRPGIAAIAGTPAARRYGLRIIAEHIEDDPHNTTRFVAVGQQLAAATGRDKTSLVRLSPTIPTYLTTPL